MVEHAELLMRIIPPSATVIVVGLTLFTVHAYLHVDVTGTTKLKDQKGAA